MRKASAKAVLVLLGGTIVLAVLTLVWAIGAGSSEAQQDGMHNCPQAGKWAISVWDGQDGSETGEALATCGEGAVDFAYYLDPETNGWLGYFEGHADISQLLTLDGKQGIIAHGAMAAPPRTPTPEPTPGAGEAAMHNCPQAGKWAISVWDGADATETGEALATCGEVTVDFAYYLDPEANGWLGYFEGHVDISQLLTLDNKQGIIAHGAMAAPVPTPTATPTAAPGLASAKEAYPLAFQAAGAWRPDAYLDGADAGCLIGIILSWCSSSDYDNMASGDGRSQKWTFSFFSPATDESILIHVAHGEVEEGSANKRGVPSDPPHPMLLEQVIDSTEAVRIADDQGGSAYKAASPGNWLCGAQIHAISVPEWQIDYSEWQIDYCPPLSQGGTGLVVWIDGGTGEVTKTQPSHWHKS